jgi:capsular polysaccharide export protein
MVAAGRTFLFLQGPHGPFFAALARALTRAGARCLRIGFNAGDRAEWHSRAGYMPFRGPLGDWPAFLDRFLRAEAVTDLVLYGDAREVHAVARQAARAAGITVHCFEEGYLRPWWVTYERGGVNGNSRLMGLSVADMRRALDGHDRPLPAAPAHWGAALAHAWHGMIYHFFVLAFAPAYPLYRTHRQTPLATELLLHLRRIAVRPWLALASRIRERRLARLAAPYHLVLLQLGHDSSMVHHSPFRTVSAFVAHCIEAFAEGAPTHHHLVFKSHPFEDGREPIGRTIRHFARDRRVAGRVWLIEGGKLGPLLDGARSAVTVNSTAGQQALWRGLPLAILGDCVYAKPELVSTRPLAAFFRAPDAPDGEAYRIFRRFLLATSQVRGGFYTRTGRTAALRVLVDAMLAAADPYDRLLHRPAAVGGAVTAGAVVAFPSSRRG